MGTVAEDIVAPNLPIIAERYFGCTTPDSMALRVKKRNQVMKEGVENSTLEFDAILTCQQYLFFEEVQKKK